MPTPTVITDLSQTAANNSPAGSDSPNVLDDTQRAHGAFIAQLRDGKGFSDPATLASAATVDIGGQNSLFVEITGTTGISSFGTNYEGPRFLRFTGILTLTHNAATMNLPGGADITTGAKDTCVAIPNSTPNGWDVVAYQRYANAPGVATSAATATSAAGLSATLAIASGGTGATTAAAAFTALKQAASETATGVVELATTAEVVTGTDTTRAVTPAGLRAANIVIGTTQATTSGTVVDFTGIPAWAHRVTVMLVGVSTTGTSNIIVQIGAGSVQASGYTGVVNMLGISATAFSTGFMVSNAVTAASIHNAKMTLVHMGGNVWVIDGHMARADTLNYTVFSGNVTLAGALDRIRLTTVNGTDTFDAGSVNIIYE